MSADRGARAAIGFDPVARRTPTIAGQLINKELE